MFLEVYDTMNLIASYSGGIDLPFVLPFNIYLVFTMRTGILASDIVSTVNDWVSAIPKWSTPNWQVSIDDI